MRRTWMSRVRQVEKFRVQIRMTFVIAVESKESAILKQLKEESDQYHDMLVIDLQDHVEKHCHKAFGFLEHFLDQCYNHKNVQPYKDPKAPYVNYPFFIIFIVVIVKIVRN